MTNKYDVIPGAEAFYIEGNEIGILLVHGFVGTPQSVEYLGKQFADKGFTVLAPRLKGHGTHFKELEDVTHEDWLYQLEKDYYKLKQVCTKVFIVGQSMGGALSLLLANKVQPSGVITINAAFQVPGYELYKNEQIIKYVQEGKPDIKDNSVCEITYPFVPVHAIKQLLAVIETSKKELFNVNSPLLLFKSIDDHVVPPASTDFVYENVSSCHKDMIELTNSYHVASMDFDKNKIIQNSIVFIRTIIASKSRKMKVSS